MQTTSFADKIGVADWFITIPVTLYLVCKFLVYLSSTCFCLDWIRRKSFLTTKIKWIVSISWAKFLLNSHYSCLTEIERGTQRKGAQYLRSWSSAHTTSLTNLLYVFNISRYASFQSKDNLLSLSLRYFN